MYYHIVKVLFDENTSAFNHYYLKNAIGFSSDPALLRYPYQISSGYFIEANIDNTTKFSRLKLLLSYFNLEDELLINFSNHDIESADNDTATREYWEEQASSESLFIIDKCYDIVKSINPDLTYNYTYAYIGFRRYQNKKNQTRFNNIAIAIPKVKFVRLELFFDNPDVWLDILKQKGIHVVSTSKNRVLRIRIDRDVVTYHHELLSELFTLAINIENIEV